MNFFVTLYMHVSSIARLRKLVDDVRTEPSSLELLPYEKNKKEDTFFNN